MWGDPPPTLEPGARLAVLSGNPGSDGPFVIRLQLPAGYRIAPHWHPTDEHVTVVSGELALGMGETFEQNGMNTLSEGGYALLPAEMRHYALATTDAVVQVHGMGPFVLNYVNPADAPAKRSESRTFISFVGRRRVDRARRAFLPQARPRACCPGK